MADEPAERRPRFRRQYDAGLHLLDRQIVDRDGAPVAKVDDLELAQRADGRIAVSALLVGPGALGPRIGGRLGRWTVAVWRRLRPDPDPSPTRIDAALVSGTESAVHLGVAVTELQRVDAHVGGFERWMRRYVIDRIPGAGHADDEERSAETASAPGKVLEGEVSRPAGGKYRLDTLLGATVVLADGSEAGHVNDVRLAGGPGLQTYVIDGLVVGRRTAGSMLGYDRREVRGPWLVRVIVAATHKDARYVPWRSVRRIDWDGGCVAVDRSEPLTHERPAS
jgi:sporulation protein YlmC with PRC-barrel domain